MFLRGASELANTKSASEMTCRHKTRGIRRMPLVLAGVARFCRAFAPAANASVRIHRPEPRAGRVNLRQRRISGGVPFKVYCAIEIEKREDL